MTEFPILLLAASIAALVIWSVWRAEKKRRLILKALARHLGLEFDPVGSWQVHQAYAHSLFQKGHSRKGSNTMFGTMILAGHSIEVRMGDYRYVVGHGKNRRTYQISYAAFRLPYVGTPDLLIRKENLGDKMMGGVGFDDIDFESEEFSRTFWVKSENKKFAYDVLHPRMMEFLLEGPTPRVELVRDVCLIQEGRGRWDPDTFEGAPGWFQAFLEHWPEHLTQRLHARHER